MAEAAPNDAKSVTDAIDGIAADLHSKFSGNAGRLEQLDAHLATVKMVIEHLYDEDARSKG